MKYFHLRVRSRNKTCAPLREMLLDKRVIYRMGSTTRTKDITKRKDYIEINSADACAISADKIEMKKRFTHAKVDTAEWFIIKPGMVNCKNNADGQRTYFCNKINYFIKKYGCVIIKHRHSSKGNGIFLIKTPEDFNNFYVENITRKYEIANYIAERYYTYSREYRLHVTKNGCFLADRKMLLNDATVRWHRHNNNSVFISEENPLFDKPTDWDLIVKSCINAMKSIGLDIAAFDVKVQNNKHKMPKWIILECNSAPGLGENSVEKYKTELTKLIYG